MTLNSALAIAYNDFCEKNFPQDPVDTKAGRFVEPDKSVRPTRDTGFRAKPSVPVRLQSSRATGQSGRTAGLHSSGRCHRPWPSVHSW